MLFGEKTPELTRDAVEDYAERWRRELGDPRNAVVMPHPTDRRFVLRARPIRSLNNSDSDNIEDNIVCATKHHKKLAKLGLSIPVYEHAICRQAIETRSMLFTTVERVKQEEITGWKEYHLKRRLRTIFLEYQDWIEEEKPSHFASDTGHPNQVTYGTGMLHPEQKPSLQLLDIEPRIHAINYDSSLGSDQLVAAQRRLLEREDRWQNMAFAPVRFGVEGQFTPEFYEHAKRTTYI